MSQPATDKQDTAISKEHFDDVAEQQVARLLVSELDRLDSGIPIVEPDLHQLTLALMEHKKLNFRKMLRELTIFLFVAVLLLSLAVAVFYRLPLTFLWVQAAAFIVLPGLYYVVTASKRRMQKRVSR